MSSARLLRLAADALDDQRDPFSESFLSKHEVTFDQCVSLAEQLATGARIMAAGIEDPRSLAGQAMLMMIAEGAMR
jgi:hypothetical protein